MRNLITFGYTRMMQFPDENLSIQNIVTKILFKNVNNLIIVKIHLHNSHITTKLHGYAHDYCNWKVRENRKFFTCV